jgi:hypothetical protein
MPSERKRTKKVVKRQVKRRRTTKEPVLVKIDFWAIAAKEVYDACLRAGFDEGTAMAFAMDRTSYPDWIVPADDPIRKPDFDDEDDD